MEKQDEKSTFTFLTRFSKLFDNAASTECHNVWALQFNFLNTITNIVPPNEACLYCCIYWTLVQAQQQPFSGLLDDLACQIMPKEL